MLETDAVVYRNATQADRGKIIFTSPYHVRLSRIHVSSYEIARYASKQITGKRLIQCAPILYGHSYKSAVPRLRTH